MDNEHHDQLIDLALRALGVHADPDRALLARRTISEMCKAYRQNAKRDANAWKFGDLRRALKDERTDALKLARRMDTITRSLPYALRALYDQKDSVDLDAEVHALLADRIECSTFLNRVANNPLIATRPLFADGPPSDIIDAPHYPKGKEAQNLARKFFLPPKEALAWDCYRAMIDVVKSKHPNDRHIASAKSPYGITRDKLLEFLQPVYELASGQSYEAKGAGLAKIARKVIATARAGDKNS